MKKQLISLVVMVLLVSVSFLGYKIFGQDNSLPKEPETTQAQTTQPVTTTESPTTEPETTEEVTEPETTEPATVIRSETTKVQTKKKEISKVVTWKPVDGVTAYNVYRSNSKDGPYKLIATVEGTSYTDKDLAANTPYYYKIQTCRSDNQANCPSTTCAQSKAPSTVRATTKTTTKAASKASVVDYKPNSSGTVTGFESEMLRKLNAYRAKAGVAPITMNADLNRLSAIRAQELSKRYRSDHIRPNGKQWYTILDDIKDPTVKNWNTAAENIAHGQKNESEITLAWYNSKGHRDNMLNPDYKYVGFGCYSLNGHLYWDQIYIG